MLWVQSVVGVLERQPTGFSPSLSFRFPLLKSISISLGEDKRYKKLQKWEGRVWSPELRFPLSSVSSEGCFGFSEFPASGSFYFTLSCYLDKCSPFCPSWADKTLHCFLNAHVITSCLVFEKVFIVINYYVDSVPSFQLCLFSLISTFIILYTLLIMLLQLSWFFPHCPPLPSTPHSLRQSLHHCSHPWIMHIGSVATPFPILYFPFPWLFCNYLFVLLNPLTSPPIFPTLPSHLATIKTLSVYMILPLFLCA